MIVVFKLGGSLLNWPRFPERLGKVLTLYEGARLVLVAGGGEAADLVRRLDAIHQLGEERAHTLAMESLRLTAELVAMLVPAAVVVETIAELEGAWARNRLPIFAPRRFMESVDLENAHPLPRTWDTTTDSIAVRVAEAIGADRLVLLKSVDGSRSASRLEAARVGVVDPNFPAASSQFSRVDFINLRSDPIRIESLD